ncbi:MAG: methylated-DNA--[protein]-cysteine S-methyltransferase [Gaiellaceae bacterium]
MAVTWVRYEVDGWGVAELCTDGRRVLWHELPRSARAHGDRDGGESPYPHPGWGKNPKPTAPTLADEGSLEGDNFASTLIARLHAYFAGTADDFADVDLDLGDLTPYGQALAQALRAVPRGDVVTYGELAALAGRPGAARAAGTFCAQNRFGVLVPCHRVVGASGLGGYGSLGSDYKRRLLALEHVAL